jgi:hypothetical protein
MELTATNDRLRSAAAGLGGETVSAERWRRPQTKPLALPLG